MDQRSNRERRSAAAAAGSVRILERKAGSRKVAFETDPRAVQILRAEFIDKQPHAGAFNDHVIRPWLLFDVQAVAEPGAPARQDGAAQARRFLGDLLFGQELLDLFARPFGERQGNRPLCSAHSYPPIWQQLRQSRRPCQPGRDACLTTHRAPNWRPMRLTIIDWIVIGAYFALNVGIGLYYKSRASKSISEFFLSGRNVPWWLAGTSMVATTFAADTPLVVTGFVAKNGIAGNWIWWSFLMSGMLTVFFYARLWRRAGVMTDIEFAEIRYSGKPAAFLRGFRAVYLGIFINCIILGWVNLAMVKILGLIFGIGKLEALAIVLGLIALTSFISTLSGLWGVLVTDMVQFVIKMGMVIALAVFAVNAVVGIDAMKEKLVSSGRGEALNLVPNLNSAWMPMITFLVYISLNWWATWYPGAEPGGGGYVAQRMFSAKDERHSMLATLWFNIAHYAIRPWPWILVALASLILFPGLADPETGYIRVLIVSGAGTGGVLLLRWYWWRINAWSEVSAMITAFVVSVFLQVAFGYDTDQPKQFALILITTVAVTTIVWLAVTYLTAPEPQEKLLAFFRRTRPSRSGWAPIAALAPDVKVASDGLSNLLDWIAGCTLVYGVLFGVGKLLLHETRPGLLLLALAALGGYVIYRDLSRRGWATVVE